MLRLLATALALLALHLNAVLSAEPRNLATCMLVFGDSTVDPGNNNRLATTAKANFPPYGRDFLSRPTGRFCNGRLATDFIAEELGISSSVRAFLDSNLTSNQLKRGVSFASASSGYDDMTAVFSNVLSLSKQVENLMHYKIHLSMAAGSKKAEEIVSNALFVVSAGTNDFVINYYLQPNRSTEFTVPKYQDYLITCMSKHIKEMRRLGGKRFLIVGVPPIGCLPIVRALVGSGNCVDKYNDVASSFNSKLVAEISALKKLLGIRIEFLDVYGILSFAIKNPYKYGFTETAKGCVGSGTIEVGESGKGASTCKDANKYIFWDAVHPTQKMYKIVADDAARGVLRELLN